ncbi:MAG: flagellar hook-associated protein FlgK [Bdellovibrionales bacterium]|nr:flagellar hook-associated protein FlgK [Bdellovibrionales bacterium]
MSRIWSMMDIGKRSMMNSQTALQTVSHNIANKSTDGYSRQRVEQQTNVPTGMGKLRIGNGARAVKVTRTNNPYLEKQIQKESVNLGGAKTRAEVLSRVEQVYNEQINKGLNKHMGEFFNSFRELSSNPESLAARTLVKETGDFLARDFKRVNKQLKEIQVDVDFQIASHIQEINEITKEIAELNEKVQIVELNDIPANDERDRREVLLKKLGELVNIRYTEGDNGMVNITAGSTAVLVSGHSSRELAAIPTVEANGKREGNFEVFYKISDSSTPVNITKQLTDGKLGGLIESRDSTINNLIDRIDLMAHSLITEVNKAHVFGFDRYNKPAQEFFKSVELRDASEKIDLNDNIKLDVGLIASAGLPNAPGDNRIANILADIQYKQVMDEGDATLDQFYNSIVGEVGVVTARANSELKAQDDLVAQLKNIRESISGVSLDEETAKMIEFQKSFDASARMIRTADEMMDTVLNLKRV